MESNNSRAISSDQVLIVDDEIDICYLLSGILKQRNFKPAFVNSLSAAKTVLVDARPRFLFLDNGLPDGLGTDFIPYIKQHYPSIKVIMITAHDSASDRKRAFDGGADAFLGKPLNRDLINATIDSLIN